MNVPQAQIRQALAEARKAYQRGDHPAVRHWVQQVLEIDPRNEAAWLWLASVSSPKASLVYLNKALEINPHSSRARQGMHWAVQRQRKTASPGVQPHGLSETLNISSIEKTQPIRVAEISDVSSIEKTQPIRITPGVKSSPKILWVKNEKPDQPNEIQAITGATISSKSVVAIINEGIGKMRELKERGNL